MKDKRRLLAALLCVGGLTSFPSRTTAAELIQLDAETAYTQGMAAFNKGDYQNAVRLLSLKARKDPGDGTVYYYLGTCYMRTKQNDQAAHMFAACVRKSASTQAGQYSLQALESLAAMAKTPAPAKSEAPDPAAAEALKESLISDKPVDKSFNDSVRQITNERYHFKTDVDKAWEQLQDDVQSLSPRTPNYQYELEKIRREAETKIEALQTRELRRESRIIAPDKIDLRAVPQLPTGKIDDAKNALGSLVDYAHPEKVFDPFGTDVNPEIGAKFFTIRDAFGELATYTPQARRLARDLFVQLKSTIENKQDGFDRDINSVKERLIEDVIQTKIQYARSGSPGSSPYQQLNPSYLLSQAKVPRSGSNYLSPVDAQVAEITDRAQKRIKQLQDGYDRSINDAIAGTKERLASIIGSGSLASQLKHPSGNVQIVPLGTNAYTQNYVNFGDRPVSTPSVRKAGPKSK